MSVSWVEGCICFGLQQGQPRAIVLHCTAQHPALVGWKKERPCIHTLPLGSGGSRSERQNASSEHEKHLRNQFCSQSRTFDQKSERAK
eukprot:886796-Amphidinium_carterae.1